METVATVAGGARRNGRTRVAARRFLDNLQTFGYVQGEAVVGFALRGPEATLQTWLYKCGM